MKVVKNISGEELHFPTLDVHFVVDGTATVPDDFPESDQLRLVRHLTKPSERRKTQRAAKAAPAGDSPVSVPDPDVASGSTETEE